ncbi:hypothetical protein B0H63DRAFT_77530 [Podospora didyma]|uniref:NWD NACHT-NTPase N-terminal domain-containing protein n=1 Tax=Podospora didyma TaxID=330526 RepID=A0AAE0K2S3_9PEZI|nr:hypothetical protein B0H63DRAFT_77530 [Podospora didyma]
MQKYKTVLSKYLSNKGQEVSTDKVQRMKEMESLAAAKAKELGDGTWKLKFAGHEFAVKSFVEPVIGVVEWAKEYIGSSVESSGSQPASVAWAGVFCLLLPLLLNPVEQDAAKAKALVRIAAIICESSLRELTYAKRYESQVGKEKQMQSRDAHETYRSSIKDLYKLILTFQATNICFVSNRWPKQMLKDLAK